MDLIFDERTLHREENTLEHEMRYAFRYYQKVREELFTRYQRIANNLATMPNNKGYIYKNMRFYGALDREEGEPDILFEHTRENFHNKYIHEYGSDYYKLSFKEGNEKPKMVKYEKR
jgi:hypothetical protein